MSVTHQNIEMTLTPLNGVEILKVHTTANSKPGTASGSQVISLADIYAEGELRGGLPRLGSTPRRLGSLLSNAGRIPMSQSPTQSERTWC